MNQKTVQAVDERELDSIVEESAEAELRDLKSDLTGDLSTDEKKRLGAIESERKGRMTLKEMVESDVEAARKIRQHNRSRKTYIAADIATLAVKYGYDIFGGGNIATNSSYDFVPLFMASGWLGSTLAQFMSEKNLKENELSDLAGSEYNRIDHQNAKELLEQSELVVFDDEFGQGEIEGEEATEMYEEIISWVQGSYEEIMEEMDESPEEYIAAYLEREQGLDPEDFEDHVVKPVVRFQRGVGDDDLPGFSYSLELYAGDELVAQYEGLVTDSLRWEIEGSSPGLPHTYDSIADTMDWKTGEPTDRWDEGGVTGHIHDAVRSTYDFGKWIGEKARNSI